MNSGKVSFTFTESGVLVSETAMTEYNLFIEELQPQIKKKEKKKYSTVKMHWSCLPEF